jgi:DNA primase
MTDLSRVDVEDFLTALGITVVGTSGANAVFKCPWHGADRHPSARMNMQTTQFICSTCHVSGNAITFLAQLRNMSNAEARIHIDQRYGTGPTVPIGGLEAEVERNFAVQAPQEERVRPSESWAEAFHQNLLEGTIYKKPFPATEALGYMLRRGFTPEILKEWQIGYDYISERITIPVRDVDGDLVGFKARATDDETHPRYKILGGRNYGFDTYHKSHHVFALHRISLGVPVVLVEGELNVVAISQKLPHLRAIAVAGSEFSERQRRQIVNRCKSVIVYFDDDSAGRRGIEIVVEELHPYMPVRVVLGAQGDAAELPTDEIEALIIRSEPALGFVARGGFS